jgi:hypothetical protein
VELKVLRASPLLPLRIKKVKRFKFCISKAFTYKELEFFSEIGISIMCVIKKEVTVDFRKKRKHFI